MKSFFEDLGRKIGETAETVTNKAGEAVEVQRLKNQIRTLERGNERDYMDLGKMVYDHYKEGEVVDAEAIGICEAIQNREESIGKYEQQISDVKGDVTCDGCGKSVARDMAYCPYCGAKAPEKAAQETADYADAVKEKAEDVADTVKDKAEDAAETVKEKTANAAETVKEKTADAAETVKEKTADAAETIKEKTADAAETIKEKASDAADMMRDKTADAADLVKDKTADFAESAKKMAEEVEEKVKQMMED